MKRPKTSPPRFVLHNAPALRLTSFVFGHLLAYVRGTGGGGLSTLAIDAAKVRQQLRESARAFDVR